MVDKKSIPKDLKQLCYYCFDVLRVYLFKTSASVAFPDEFKGIECPIFVTWTIGKEADLRGCIGTFQADSLETILPKYALIAAIKDTRFNPISKDEFSQLQVGVSLLVNFEENKDAMDWEVGTHGIQIFYKNYGATFLPEVASEQGWDKQTTLEHLLKKSGCREKLDKVIKEISLTRYQSYKCKVSVDDYTKIIQI
jgi:AMME syndrome candidate gene 1 protein